MVVWGTYGENNLFYLDSLFSRIIALPTDLDVLPDYVVKIKGMSLLYLMS